MIDEKTYDSLRNNKYLISYRKYKLDLDLFDELLIQLLIIVEKDNKFETLIHLIRDLKVESKMDLMDTKYFVDIFIDLGLIDVKNKIINSDIFYIDSFDDICKIIDNKIDVNQYIRYKKINKIKNKLKY